MIELYINNQPVVIPEDISLSITEENPMFTKDGKYSYDITLSLMNPINAKVFGHINRFNAKAANQTYTAYLLVDNRVALNGTAIILSYTNTNIKIQLVAGKSEFNFKAKDKKIRELDLGTATLYQGTSDEISAQVLADFGKGYPDRDFQLFPYATEYTDTLTPGSSDPSSPDNIVPPVGNAFKMYWPTGEHIPIVVYQPDHSGQVPQPYLLFIIKKIVAAMGYNLIQNELESTEFKQVYIVNGVQTLEYAKMLPDWTVSEFFKEIDNLFDCTLLINEFNKTASLLFNYNLNAISFNTIYLNDIDDFSNDIDNTSRLSLRNANVGYNLDNNLNGQFMKLPDKLKDKKNVDPFVSMKELAIYLADHPTMSDIIFNTKDDDSLFIRYVSKNGNVSIKKVDSFCDLINNPNSKNLDIEFKIVPATMVVAHVTPDNYDAIPSYPMYPVQFPVAEDADALNGDYNNNIRQLNIQEEIENSKSDKSKPSKIRLAFWGQIFFYTGIGVYPACCVESLPEWLNEDQPFYDVEPRIMDKNPFRLSYLNELIYRKSGYIDTTNKLTISFRYNGYIDINSRFIINNKRFLCNKLEYKITANGYDPLIKGEFYPE